MNNERRKSSSYINNSGAEEVAEVENSVKTPIINSNSDFSINDQLLKASQKMDSHISNFNKLQENYMQAKDEQKQTI